jgi:hypothetical protein
VLHAVCQDPRVAKRIVEGVLQARQPPPRSRKRDIRVPGQLRCQDEAGITALKSRGRIRRAGRADLVFTAPRFRLVVELKMNQRLTRAQVQAYSARGTRVAAVVRDPDDALKRVGSGISGWLGAVAWEDLLPIFETLPVGSAQLSGWQAVLATCEQFGDFARAKPRTSGDAASQDVLRRIKGAVLEQLAERLRRKYRGSDLGSRLEVDQDVGVRGGFAIFAVSLERDVVLIVRLRDADSTSPLVYVDWFPPHAMPLMGAVHRATKQLLRSRKYKWHRRQTKRAPSYRHQTRLPAQGRPRDVPGRVRGEINAVLDHLVRQGAFDWDAAR